MTTPETEAFTRKSSVATAKQVRLNLVYIDLWSAVKVSAMVALAISVAVFLTVILSWFLLSAVGVIGALEGVIGDILGDGGGGILALLQLEQVLVLAGVGALINVLSLTVLGSVGAVMYNAIARFTGGLTVGFTNT
ncbi:MAG: DUF3566 domain-containing protein [Actinobacteria bacterium]|jgi:hypothetical protein|uniref:Unannotated protein n=1 Tax=freshwater metagenome TaxID=449393 RepID=A0A6J6KIK6_9ZZZZ|nr:DUF3566 domain-containing protein [Actinomycetota bacterium]MTA33454.1 DUF3566 domain-containing protein [Actinomycetota bacterium]